MTTSHLRRVLLSAVVLAGGASAAAADPPAALVLRTEGSADAATRARVDAVVLRLAKRGGLPASAGDISYAADAAAAVGCAPEAAACREEVMATLSVDEIVTATASVAGGELKVVVRRGGKGAPAREATATVALSEHGDAGLEAGLGSLFGLAPPPPPTPPPAVVKPTPPPTAIKTTAPPPDDEPLPGIPPAPPPHAASPPPDALAPAPGPSDTGSSHHTLHVVGAITGGAAIVLGILSWGAARNTENEIQAAPTKTSADLAHLHDLETQGDSQANGGNFLFVAGLVIGGVSGYFLYRDHQRAHAAQHARITPMLVDHGAGLALTFGGSP